MENGQVRASALDHLDHCCRLVSTLYGKPDISAWTNSDYVKLGYILYKKTQVQISPNTLKRIFGKIKTDVRYYPQRATRDALARYVGYSDWDRFTYAVPHPPPATEHLPETAAPQEPVIITSEIENLPKKKTSGRWLAWITLGVVILLAGIVYKVFFLKKELINASLICENPVGDNPHSATFLIQNMAAGEEDHYLIDFGDNRKLSVVPGDSLYSHYYEVPGTYQAVLKMNDIPLDTVSILLKTSGWTATGEMMYDTTRVYPIEKQSLFVDGKMRVNIMDVARAGIDTNRTFFIKFINTQVTDIDGDNFDLRVKVKSSPSRAGVRCSQVRVTVYGEAGRHLVDAMKPGCVHWTDLQFSEINMQGELNQLQFLGVDLHEGGTIEMKVAEKHAQVSINAKKVFETVYQKPLKKICGVGINFSGLGAIESVALRDLKTGKLFDGNFE